MDIYVDVQLNNSVKMNRVKLLAFLILLPFPHLCVVVEIHEKNTLGVQEVPEIRDGIDHTTHFHTNGSKQVLPVVRMQGRQEKGFQYWNDERDKRFILYDDIWEADAHRDAAHRQNNRHLAREGEILLDEDTNLDRDLLIYVALLICLIIPYAGMVICRKFCPQILHGEEARAAALEEQQKKKETGKGNKSADLGIVEIVLTKKKKPRDSGGGKEGNPERDRRMSYFEKNNEEGAERRNSGPRASGGKRPLQLSRRSLIQSFLRIPSKTSKVVPMDDKCSQRMVVIRNYDGGDANRSSSGNSSPSSMETISVLKRMGDHGSDADDEGDGDVVYYEVPTIKTHKTLNLTEV